MRGMELALLLVLVVLSCVNADIYLHHPRGSNNRLNEANNDRNTENRVFDSQNNARGGYTYGPPMSYTVGSLLPVEWTAQHGCGSPTVQCNIIVQYMCTDPKNDPSSVALRDGTTTDRITDNANQYNQKNANGEYQNGMHESYQYYQDCKARERNKGLFTADQNLNNNGAISTRQNNQGTQNGFECPEERDYYPYWAPTPWKDIQLYAANAELCDLFKTESQNVKAKYSCTGTTTTTAGSVPNNQAACTAGGGQWTATPAFGIPAPVCEVGRFSRDNHLGNVDGDGNTAGFNWTIPNEPCTTKGLCDCALRVRYNVSNTNTVNYGPNTVGQNENAILKKDPSKNVSGTEFTMALDTAQSGRTFQDRSYMFHIVPRPAGIPVDATIYNLNVRGKRGNIVQTFPATEYDFVPNNLRVKQGEYIHFQWTGGDTNPGNFDGEGTAGTDRSNIVQVADSANNLPIDDKQIGAYGDNLLFDDPTTRKNMALVGQTNCPSLASLLAKNGNNQNAVNQDVTNCAKLNAAPRHFDGGVQRINKTGTFYYMSTRNNNFSNRSQRGTLIVDPSDPSDPPLGAAATIAVVIGVVAGVAVAAVVGAIIYGKKKPHSKLGELVDKLPLIGSGGSSSGSTYTFSGDRQKPLLG